MEKYKETQMSCANQVEFRIRYEIYDTEQGRVTETWYDAWRFDRAMDWDERMAYGCEDTDEPDYDYVETAPQTPYVTQMTDPDPDNGVASKSTQAAADDDNLVLTRFGSGAKVVVNDNVLNKVTSYHEVPAWQIARGVSFGQQANFKVRESYYTPYQYRVWEWICDDSGCERTSRNVYMRMVIDWNDGIANHGDLITMYCKTSRGHVCPTWVQELPVYLGPPGPQ
jgi:hypothetical protein